MLDESGPLATEPLTIRNGNDNDFVVAPRHELRASRQCTIKEEDQLVFISLIERQDHTHRVLPDCIGNASIGALPRIDKHDACRTKVLRVARHHAHPMSKCGCGNQPVRNGKVAITGSEFTP